MSWGGKSPSARAAHLAGSVVGMHASWLHRIGSNPRALAGASAARAAPCKHGHAPMRAHAVHPRACLTSEPTMRRTQRELLLSSPPPSPTSSSQRLPPACRLLPLRPPPSPRSRRCARRPRAALTVLTRLAAIAALTAVVSRLPAFGQRASAWPAALSPPSHAVVAAVLAAGAPPSPQARRPRRCAHRRRGPCRRPPRCRSTFLLHGLSALLGSPRRCALHVRGECDCRDERRRELSPTARRSSLAARRELRRRPFVLSDRLGLVAHVQERCPRGCCARGRSRSCCGTSGKMARRRPVWGSAGEAWSLMRFWRRCESTSTLCMDQPACMQTFGGMEMSVITRPECACSLRWAKRCCASSPRHEETWLAAKRILTSVSRPALL